MEEYRKYEPIFGSWYLSKLIGKGSFGKVFEIRREEFGKTYRSALKIISIPQDDDDVRSRIAEGTDIASVTEYYEEILKEIVNENEIMSQLKGNSNIVSYEDHQIYRHDDGIGYDILIRMELLTPLLDRMLRSKLEESEVVRLGIDICKALEVCHRKNIIHRDIKPQNIFISDNGDFKLGDFGIARTMEKTTGGMSKKGTYKYMAPEVFRGDDYDQTADIYSLGIVLYSLLNGNRGPFLPAPPARVTPADEENARMRRFRGEELPPIANAGMMLSYIIGKACAFDPSARYQSAREFRSDLESYYNNYDFDDGTVMMPVNDIRSYSREYDRDMLAESGSGQATGLPAYTGRHPRATGSYPAPRQTGSYTGSYNMPPGQMPREVAGMGGTGSGSGGSGENGIKKLIIPLAAGLLIIIAGIILLLSKGCEDSAPAEKNRVMDNVEGITVLSSDWDWDSSRFVNGDGYIVDAIVLVQNNSDTPITGIDFEVFSKEGDYIGNAADPDKSFSVYGYVKSGSTGIMIGEIHTGDIKYVPDDKTYSIKRAYINDDIAGYTVPSGAVTNVYGPENDDYDVYIDNPNDVPVNSSAKVVMVYVRDNEVQDSDATGRLTAEIGANTSGYIQEKAFYDPNMHSDPAGLTVYAIDIDYYDIPADDSTGE